MIYLFMLQFVLLLINLFIIIQTSNIINYLEELEKIILSATTEDDLEENNLLTRLKEFQKTKFSSK